MCVVFAATCHQKTVHSQKQPKQPTVCLQEILIGEGLLKGSRLTLLFSASRVHWKTEWGCSFSNKTHDVFTFSPFDSYVPQFDLLSLGVAHHRKNPICGKDQVLHTISRIK